MSELFSDGAVATDDAVKKPWYRRKASQIAIAGAATAGLVAGGVALGTTAGTASNPEAEVLEAAQSLLELPTAVTVSSLEEPGELSLVVGGEGFEVGLETPELGSIDLAMVEEKLFVRVDMTELSSLTNDPMLAGFTALMPSVGSLLDGQWVSLDISEDSPVLQELVRLETADVPDQAAYEAALEEFAAELTVIAEDLKGPAVDAIQEHVSVVEPAEPIAGPVDSTHYQVVVDSQELLGALEPALREAVGGLTDAIQPLIELAGPIQGELGADEAIAQLEAMFDQALAEAALDSITIDTWVANGEFTQIIVDEAKFVFEATTGPTAPQGAVSMDDDLLILLQFVQELDGQLI